MYGDYDSVFVNPYLSSNEKILNWMRGSTDLNYFAEKVQISNQYHEVKCWDKERAINYLKKYFNEYWNDYKEELKNYKYRNNESENELLKLLRNEGFDINDLKLSQKITIINRITDICESKFDTEEQMIEFLTSYIDCDAYEWDCGKDYTHALKWQHECLLWWANNIKENEALNNE
jgi:hypothetical protein